MSARLNRPVISGPTWISLTLADVAIWVIAEVQHSAGSLRTAFDAVWLASFLGFILLLTTCRGKTRGVRTANGHARVEGARPFLEVMGLFLSKERLGVFHRFRTASVSVL